MQTRTQVTLGALCGQVSKRTHIPQGSGEREGENGLGGSGRPSDRSRPLPRRTSLLCRSGEGREGAFRQGQQHKHVRNSGRARQGDRGQDGGGALLGVAGHKMGGPRGGGKNPERTGRGRYFPGKRENQSAERTQTRGAGQRMDRSSKVVETSARGEERRFSNATRPSTASRTCSHVQGLRTGDAGRPNPTVSCAPPPTSISTLQPGEAADQTWDVTPSRQVLPKPR